MVEINLIGVMTATEVFFEQLRDGGGDIVNVSLVAGRTAPADFAATKLGIPTGVTIQVFRPGGRPE